MSTIHYERIPGETDEQLLCRMVRDKYETKATWQDIANEMNRLTEQNYTETKYRKSFRKMFDSGMDNARELAMAKIQFRDERNSWNRQNYVAARATQKLDYLEEELLSIAKEQFVPNEAETTFNGNEFDLVAILSDLHIGQTFSNVFGEYNSDIAKVRLNKYANEILRKAKLYDPENLYVVLCGDLISGNIHKSIQVTNRESVISQIKIASQYIASFVDYLAPHFKNVYITGVSGNHSRIDKKEDAMHDERLDDLILWVISILLSQHNNIYVEKPNLDIGIAKISIRGNDYVAVHGDYDKMTDAGLGKIAALLGDFPYCVILGHNHYGEVTTCGGVKIARGGSLAGSGDQFTIEKRLTGDPEQTMIFVSDKGIEDACFINLK